MMKHIFFLAGSLVVLPAFAGDDQAIGKHHVQLPNRLPLLVSPVTKIRVTNIPGLQTLEFGNISESTTIADINQAISDHTSIATEKQDLTVVCRKSLCGFPIEFSPRISLEAHTKVNYLMREYHMKELRFNFYKIQNTDDKLHKIHRNSNSTVRIQHVENTPMEFANLTNKTTVGDLKSQIKKATSIPVDRQTLAVYSKCLCSLLSFKKGCSDNDVVQDLMRQHKTDLLDFGLKMKAE